MKSDEVASLHKALDDIFGKHVWNMDCIQECTVTNACANREIPDGKGAMKMSDEVMKQITNMSFEYWQHLFRYNHNEYSRLSMGNLVWQLRSHVEDMIGILPDSAKNSSIAKGHKLHLFAAHDFTLLALLTDLAHSQWDFTWPEYASMLSFELYKSNEILPSGSQYIFRAVYNSKPLKLDGCDDELCDVNMLLKILSFGKEEMPCDLHPEEQVDTYNDHEEDHCFATKYEVSGYIAMSIILSTLFGAGIASAVFILVFGVSCRKWSYGSMPSDVEFQTLSTNSMHS
jgi:hypothetical protein